MASEIIYVCHSVNNKNVRRGELKILRNMEQELYFEFGEMETNIKKRFYNDKETLRKDFEALQKLKAEEDAERDQIKEDKVEVESVVEPVESKAKEKIEKEQTEKMEVQKESKRKFTL